MLYYHGAIGASVIVAFDVYIHFLPPDMTKSNRKISTQSENQVSDVL